MTQKHTPGPWAVVDVRAKGALVYFRIDAGESRVGFAGTYLVDRVGNKTKAVADEEAEANAHLIAAAPDLLEALDAAQLALAAVADAAAQEGFGQLADLIDGCMVNARTAIARARGETA